MGSLGDRHRWGLGKLNLNGDTCIVYSLTLRQFHPVHVHLIDFFILVREGNDGVVAPDRFGLSGAPKDVMYLGPGETIYVIARFGPHRGEYMLVR